MLTVYATDRLPDAYCAALRFEWATRFGKSQMMPSAHIDPFVRNRLPLAEHQPEFRFDLPELGYPARLNAAVELIERADRHAIAVINDAGSWTYDEIAARSDAIARLLVEQEGLVPGNRVLLRGPNTATMFTAWLGVLKAGGVVVATMPILRAGEVATIIERAQISHAIVDIRSIADFDTACAATPVLRSILHYDGDNGNDALSARLANVAPGFVAVDTHRDDPALIAFTSGTTGIPKGCVQYHRDILAPADAFARHILKPGAGDRWLCSAPIAFTFGLGMQLIFPWRSGGTAVTVETAGSAAMLDAIARFGVTVLATAPTAYKALLGTAPHARLASLRTCVSAGEHLPEAVRQAWRDTTGHTIINGIGATEMMHIFVSASGADIRDGATGRAVPGYEAMVLDEHNLPIAVGTGRLAVKGPTGCRYLDDPRQSDYVINGWNVTGDTFRRDEDGYFFYVARSDDMIVSSGYNIGAPEVENALCSHPAVRECAVIGVPCPERGMRVKAFIVVAVGFEANALLTKDLQDHVKARIAPYKYPREIAFVTALPKTETGKIQRFALRSDAGAVR